MAALRTVKFWMQLLMLGFITCLIVFQFWAPSANVFRHTYELSNPPGTLYSERWSYNFIVSGSFVFLWLVPLTMAFMFDSIRSLWRRRLHLILVIILLGWFLASFIYGIVDWAKANGTGSENFYNPANDYRWCGPNHIIPGAPCFKNMAWNPPVAQADLITNPTFLWQLWWSFIFIGFLLLELILVVCWILPSLEYAMDAEMSGGGTEDVKLPLVANEYRGRRR